jgi:Zn-dependent peptidase ImmA (M78 family)
MVAVIESAGGVIYRYSFGTRRLSAVSHWPPSSRPIFLVNSELRADRTRFSLAHELGHLVMHGLPSAGEMEREADQFASEFLMPEREIAPSLGGLTLEGAAQLKAYWKVSIQALIMRARDVGAIPPSRATRLFAELSRLGYRTSEPVNLPTEEPTLLRSVLDTHRQEHDYSLDDLVALSGMPMEDFMRFHPGDRPRLRVVS